MKFSLIIPTYNEKDNITVLIGRLLKLLKPFDYEIIVVDDNSPDKTWKIVQQKYKKNRRVKVLRRMNKRGLISAITDGFDKAKGEFIGVMDADMQHAKDTRTAAQKESLVLLLRTLKKLHPQAVIYGHRDFSSKACPSFDAKTEYADI